VERLMSAARDVRDPSDPKALGSIVEIPND